MACRSRSNILEFGMLTTVFTAGESESTEQHSITTLQRRMTPKRTAHSSTTSRIDRRKDGTEKSVKYGAQINIDSYRKTVPNTTTTAVLDLTTGTTTSAIWRSSKTSYSAVPILRNVGGTMRWWRRAVCVMVILLSMETSGHLVKEFTSARKEAARSMEPDKGYYNGNSDDVQVGAILCEKYNEWSKWSPCSRKCEQTRVRRCRIPEECGKSWVKEKRTCMREKGDCMSLSYKVIGMQKRNRMIEEILYDLLYSNWTQWGPCTRSCRQRRQRKCKYKAVCVRSYIQEERRCLVKGSHCEHRYSLKPVGLGYEEHLPENNNNNNNNDDDDEGDYTDYTGNDNENEEDKYDIEDYDMENEDYYQVELGKEEGENEDTGGDGGGGGGGGDDGGDDDIDEDSSSKKKLWRKQQKVHRKKERKATALGEEVTSAQMECGIRPRTGSYRVVGGTEVHKNSWPWQVAILTKREEQYCGGTLIAPRWVLTAAHCVRKKGKRRKLIVRVGEHDITEIENTQDDIRPEEEFPHPEFDYQTITNDIALIKLRHPPSAFTQPGYACLPTEDYVPPKGDLCTIVGWGKLKNTHIYGSDSLQEVQVPVVRHRRCQRVFDYTITEKQVCAGYKRGGKDSCAGDSGGPLLCNTEHDDQRYVLYGVTSYGEGCGRRGKFGIYTKVASYLDWIYTTISENR